MAKTIDIPIEELVPHGDPMILIRRMLEADRDHNICEVAILPESPFARPDGVPAFVGIEYMAQAIAAHAGYLARLAGEPVKTGFLLGTPRLFIDHSVFPTHHVFHVRIKRDWGEGELMRFHCTIVDAGNNLRYQEAGLNVYQPRDLEAYLAQNGASEYA